MNSGPFKILDKIDTAEIYRSWKESDPSDNYDGFENSWHVKECKVYENDAAVILFESDDKDNAYIYRWYFYEIVNGRMELKDKLRIHNCGFTVDGFGYDGKSIYACTTFPDNGIHDLVLFNCGSKSKLITDYDNLELEDISDEYFLLNSDSDIYLVKYPEEIQVIATDSIYNLIEEWREKDLFAKNGVSENTDEDDNKEDDDEDDDDDDDDDEDDDDWSDEDKPYIKVTKAVCNGKTGLEELNDLIGLEDIKRQINKIVAFTKMQKAMSAGGSKGIKNINMNMIFSGAPGTAKTTVARIVAKILKEYGILSKGDLVEVGRADLVAKYIGQTAPRVKEIFKRAKGNLLFIDEAYALAEGGDRDYGDEAIATIVQEMENNRDDLVVIFAGYEDKMEEFVSKNPGLRSRIPFVIKFEDYSADELTQIAKSEASKKGFNITKDAEKKIKDICALARENCEFGNGRFSRNLVESAMMTYAMRVYGNSTAGFKDENCVLIAEDFELPDNMKKVKQVRRIGF